MKTLALDTLEKKIGKELGLSEWTSVTQEEVDLFAKVSRDPDPMHIDPEWAKQNSPFGQTVLFGFQTLSLLTFLSRNTVVTIEGASLLMNYGLDRVRLVSPIPVGALFRNRIVLKGLDHRKDGTIAMTTTNTIEVENSDKPALVADWVSLIWPEADAASHADGMIAQSTD